MPLLCMYAVRFFFFTGAAPFNRERPAARNAHPPSTRHCSTYPSSSRCHNVSVLPTNLHPLSLFIFRSYWLYCSLSLPIKSVPVPRDITWGGLYPVDGILLNLTPVLYGTYICSAIHRKAKRVERRRKTLAVSFGFPLFPYVSQLG